MEERSGVNEDKNDNNSHSNHFRIIRISSLPQPVLAVQEIIGLLREFRHFCSTRLLVTLFYCSSLVKKAVAGFNCLKIVKLLPMS